MSYYLPLSGQTGSTCTASVTKGAIDHHWLYRCVITDAKGNTVTTNSAYITAPLALYDQSNHRYTTTGAKVSFFVTPMGGKAPYSYQWQYINDVLADYVNVDSNFSSASGYNTNTLSLTASIYDFGLHNRFRCEITDAKGEIIYSEPVGVYEYMAISIPNWVAVPFNGTIEFESKITGGVGPYKYEWQFKEPHETDYKKIPEGFFEGVNTGTLKFVMTSSLWSMKYDYRLKVTDSKGRSEFSNVAHAYHLEM